MAEAIQMLCRARGGCDICYLIQVKWPNDVLINGKKVAGILTESRSGAIVVGAGVNVSTRWENLPVRKQYPASTVLAETGIELDRVALAEAWAECLMARYQYGTEKGLHDWDAWDALRGIPVRLNTAHGILEGIGAGIDPDGALLLDRGADGIEHIVAGDVLP